MKIPGLYTHSLSGDAYYAEGIAIDATNEAPPRRLVVYRNMKDEWFVRDVGEFFGLNSAGTPRFVPFKSAGGAIRKL